MSLKAAFILERGRFRLDIDVDIPAPGVTVVFGPSGSGKTTLLRCLAGLEHPCGSLMLDGRIWIDQERGIFLPAHKRHVGVVFQYPQLFEHLDVMGNLRYAAARSAATRQEVDDMADLVGIPPLLGRRPSSLSGGERQRVAIARAMLAKPVMLLLDEPFSALDVASKDEILPYIGRINSVSKIPVLYVTHSLDEVLTLADHLVLMQDGRITASSTVNDLLARLDTPLALRDDASIILPGRVFCHDQIYQLTEMKVGREVLRIPLVQAAIDQSVRVRVQARDVSLCLQRPEQTSILNILPARVSGIEPVGPAHGQRLVRLDLDDGDILLARISALSAELLSLQIGMRLYAQIKSVVLV